MRWTPTPRQGRVTGSKTGVSEEARSEPVGKPERGGRCLGCLGRTTPYVALAGKKVLLAGYPLIKNV